MTRALTSSFVVMAVLAGSLLACGDASAASVNQVIYKTVQQTPHYDVSRPEVPSGATITLFANFLGNEPGYVVFNLHGTSTQCEVVDWKNNSVTTALPKLGLNAPQNAGSPARQARRPHRQDLPCPLHQPARPAGPHGDTVPQPLPPAPASEKHDACLGNPPVAWPSTQGRSTGPPAQTATFLPYSRHSTAGENSRRSSFFLALPQVIHCSSVSAPESPAGVARP